MEEGEIEQFRTWLRDWEAGATQDIEVAEYEEEEITEALQHIDEAQDSIN